MPERRHLPTRVSLIRRRPRRPRRLAESPDRGAATAERSTSSGLVDSAVYCDGARQCSPASLADTFRALREQPDGMAWIGLYRPDRSELDSLAEELTCTSSPSTTPSTPTNGRSWSATAARCSSCCARRATSTTSRRSSSASCTCSSARTS